MAWLRMHDNILDHPKIQMLSDRAFRMLINLWALAKRGRGKIPDNIQKLAFTLRMPEARVRETLQTLVTANLINKTEDGWYEPHDWKDHQYERDVSTERVKRFRERKMKRDETAGGNGSETVPSGSMKPPQTTDNRVQSTETDNNNNHLNTATASEEFVVVVELLTDFKTLPEKRRRVWEREFQVLRENFAFSEVRRAAEKVAAQGGRINSLNYLASLIEASGNGEPRPNGKDREADEAARRALQAEMVRVSPPPPDYSFLAGEDVAH